jgi:hypothetical protein
MQQNNIALTKKRGKPCNLAYVALSFLIVLSATAYLSMTQTLPTIEDTIGYAHAGQRLANGHGLTYEDANNQIAGPYFSLYAFQVRRDDDSSRTFLGFPPGFPILLASAIIITGNSTAAYFVAPLLAVLGILATFCLGRLIGSDNWTGLLAAMVLAFSPTYLEFGTSSWSEIPSLTFVASGICLYLFTRRGSRYARTAGLLLSVLGGLSIAYSFFIRYTNLAMVPPLMAYELYTARRKALTEWRRWFFFGPVVLGMAAIPAFNQFYYGGPLLTSYSPVHGWYPWSPFSLSYALGPSPVNGFSLVEAAKTLWRNFSWLLPAAPVGWLLLKRSSAVLISGATLSTIVIYAFYAFAPTGVNSRFLLPVFPLLCVAIGYTITQVGTRLCARRWQRWGAGFLLALILYWPVPGRLQRLQTRNTESIALVNYVQSLVAATPTESVFLSYVYNDQIAFYGHRSVLNYRRIPPSDPNAERYRMETLEPCLVQAVESLLDNQIPVYYVEDKSPPLWNSLALLQQNFETKLVQQEPNIYNVIKPATPTEREGLFECDL